MKYIFTLFNILFLTAIISAQQYELEEISFEGNETISDSKLSAAISSQESPGWFFKFLNSFTSFGSGPIYIDTLELRTDVSRIEDYYFDHGFFETDVNYTFDIDTNNNTATAAFHIVEGDPSTYNKFEVLGLDTVDSKFTEYIRNNIIEIDTTERYIKEDVKLMIEKANNYLKDNGYMLAENEKPLVIIDTMKNEAGIEVTINSGKRYTISDVRVDLGGQSHLVKESLVRKIVDINEGETYSFVETRRAQVRLYRTNLFSSALVNGVVSDTNGNMVPLRIAADVTKLNELAPEIIANDEGSAFNLGLGINYNRKNFLGGARLLSLNTSVAAQNLPEFISSFSFDKPDVYGYTDFRVSIEQPYLFNEPINTKWESYLTFQKRKDEYQARIIGTGISFNIEMPPRSFVTALIPAINWENSEYTFEDSYLEDGLWRYFTLVEQMDSIPALNRAQEYVATHPNSTRNISTTTSISLGSNKTNSVLFPTSGYSLDLYIEEGNGLAYLAEQMGASEINNALYFKGLFEASYFPEIYESETAALGLNLQAGNIFPYQGSRNDIPLNQRFYAGGNTSVRGWGSRELIPELDISKISLDDINDVIRGLSPGGFFIVEGSIETRNRITGALGGAVFFDFGNVWKDITKARINEVALAPGFGIRYYSEFAPIRIDFGFKLYSPYNEDTIINSPFFPNFFDIMTFHLGIGEAF